MGEIKFSSAGMQQIINQYETRRAVIAKAQQDINEYIAKMRSNWTDSENNLVGREKDFRTITDNVQTILSNVDAMIAFLKEKQANFEKVNYKF